MAERLPTGCVIHGLPGSQDAVIVVHFDGPRTVAFEWRGAMWRPLRVPYSLLKRHGGLERMFPFPCRMISFQYRTFTGRFVRVGGLYWLSAAYWWGLEQAREWNWRALVLAARVQVKVKGWRPEEGCMLSWRDVLLAGD